LEARQGTQGEEKGKKKEFSGIWKRRCSFSKGGWRREGAIQGGKSYGHKKKEEEDGDLEYDLGSKRDY